MFSIDAARYYLYREPIDMRKSFDGLSGLVNSRLGRDPMDGDVYIFINRRRDRIKLLRWKPCGYVLFYMRLEKGSFELPQMAPDTISVHVDYGELAMLITGISMRNARKRPRYLSRKTVENSDVKHSGLMA